MTDKQIIINGVDVSGCTRYCSDTGKCTAFKSQYLCSERNNCYTKRILKKNKTINILKEKLLCKEQECERLKWYLKEIRDDELKTLDIELDEYETHCIDTEYTNIINLVEEALEERSPEDCRYKKDK